MPTYNREQTHATYPTLTRRQALIIFIASVSTMSVGWVFAAFIPLWLAPPAERLGQTLLLYLLLPCLLWSMVPVILFKRWKLNPMSDSWIYWSVRYILLSVIWLVGFLLTFNVTYQNNVYWNLTLNIFSQTSCTPETTNDGVVTYRCKGGVINSWNCPEEDYVYLPGDFDQVGLGCPYQYTFEGRQGLPFVWYTGEITPTAEGEND